MLIDHQIGFGDESTYGTAVTVDRFFEYNSEAIAETEGRTEGDPLRVGQHYRRSDRWTPYFSGAAGPVQLDVLTKGFGYFLKHMLGTTGTTGPAETAAYTHAGTVGDLWGDFFTCQVVRPFNPSGTAQAFTYSGGKITEWALSNAVDGNLLLDLGLDFQQVATDTAKATASYPSGMENLSWAGAVVTIGGSQYDVTDISISGNNGVNVDRRFLAGTTDKKEPTSGRRELTFSLTADFDSLTQRNRAHADARADALAEIVATWTGPTAIAGTTTPLYPKLTVTIPAARFDSWQGAAGGPEGITQTLSGVGLDDTTGTTVEIDYVSADATA